MKVYADLYVSSSGLSDTRSDALVAPGGAAELVDLLLRWQRIGVDGVRLRPAVTAVDLPFIVDEVVPLLRDGGRLPNGLPRRRDPTCSARPPGRENRYQEASRP